MASAGAGPSIRPLQAIAGTAITLLALPSIFFLSSASLLVLFAGGIILGTSLAVDRGFVLRMAAVIIVLAASVGLFTLFAKLVFS